MTIGGKKLENWKAAAGLLATLIGILLLFFLTKSEAASVYTPKTEFNELRGEVHAIYLKHFPEADKQTRK